LILGLPNACFRCKQTGHFIRNCSYRVNIEKRDTKSSQRVDTNNEDKEEANIGEVDNQMDIDNKVRSMEENQGEESNKDHKEAIILREMEKKRRYVSTQERRKEESKAKEDKRMEQIGKENIPPREIARTQGEGDKRTESKNKLVTRGKDDNMFNALTLFDSPTPPIIREFIEEALKARTEEMEEEAPAQGYQEVKRKPKRNRLITGGRDEQKGKGKVQKICNE